jgi:hypothetical protein
MLATARRDRRKVRQGQPKHAKTERKHPNRVKVIFSPENPKFKIVNAFTSWVAITIPLGYKALRKLWEKE